VIDPAVTSGGLRVQADRHRAHAAELQRAAVRLRVIADTIRHLLADLSARSRLVWRGPAATDFERRADDADNDLRGQASTLVATAVEMEGEARRLRRVAAELEARARVVEAAARGGFNVVPPPWPGA
jgi:hypothetical protein